MVTETDLALDDGRTLHLYDTGTGDGTAGLPVFWHHGTPSTGAPPEPLFASAAERGIRWVSHDRPGYGGSTPHPGRDVASAAADVARVADAMGIDRFAMGIDRFAVMGVSGGGAHALACAAALPGRVLAAVCMSGPAPFDAEGLDWFAGMAPSGAAEYRAAATGREALDAHLASANLDSKVFTPADHAALFGPWSWTGTVVDLALQTDRGGIVDDDLAYVTPWGCDLRTRLDPQLQCHGLGMALRARRSPLSEPRP